MLILLGALAAAPAAAQDMYPGQSVTVNPAAADTRVLLYPGGRYVRILPLLAEPGAPYPGTALPPVHLHMPIHYRVAHVHRRAPKVATTEPPADTTTAPADDAAQPPPPAPVVRHHKQSEAAPEAPATSDTGDDGGIPLSLGGGMTVAPPHQTAQKQATTKTASAEPPPAHTAPPEAKPQAPAAAEPGLTRRGEIVFNHDATDPAPVQYDGLKRLASDLNAALQAGATRVQIEAYGGAPGDKGSDARRLSLKRALAIRQVLIDDGVPSGKIDVRAMGGIDDSGNADRVDVYVRAG
jgi:outer membrane protein OmpA-like peptidoglycan-associated protein